MLRFVSRRLVFELVPMLFMLSIVIFLVLRVLPGDPLRALIGDEITTLPPEQRQLLLKDLGLDRPLYEQYVVWLRDLLQGDWGRSFVNSQSVTTLISQRAPVTLQVASLAWLVAVTLSVPIGVFSALKRNTWVDAVVNVLALGGVATPNFLLGLVLIILLAVTFNLLPTNGFVSLWDDPVTSLKYMVMPVIALATSTMASLIRQTRSAMLEVLSEDYIRTAQAKGLAQKNVIWRHALKNALLPVVTMAGLQIGNLLSGTVIVETMFSIPGMGSLTVSAIYGQDYALVQVIVVLLAISTVLGSLAADLVYTWIDPRIRY